MSLNVTMHFSVVSQIKAKQSWEEVGKTAANTIKLIWLVNVILIVWKKYIYITITP